MWIAWFVSHVGVIMNWTYLLLPCELVCFGLRQKFSVYISDLWIGPCTVLSPGKISPIIYGGKTLCDNSKPDSVLLYVIQIWFVLLKWWMDWIYYIWSNVYYIYASWSICGDMLHNYVYYNKDFGKHASRPKRSMKHIYKYSTVIV